MTKNKYKKRCKKLFKTAKSKNLSLEFEPNNYNPKRLNCLWHGGRIALIKVSPKIDIVVEAIGDVIVTLFDKYGNEVVHFKDKSNGGYFENEMISYIKDDKELTQVINNGRLYFDNNNWIEYNGYFHEDDGKTYFVDLGMITENVLDTDNLIEGLEYVLENHWSIVNEIVEVYDAT